jgi:hypothetical protein
MGIVAAAESQDGLSPVCESGSWKLNSLKPAEDQCFRESISLNIVRTELALEVLESAEGLEDIQRDSWPHLEMALDATVSRTFAVAHPPLVLLSENGNGWWYHSSAGMDVYLRQIEIIKESIESGTKISWAVTLYNNQVSWGFAAMAFEMRINGRGFQKDQVERARNLGLAGLALLATRLIRRLPYSTLKFLQQIYRLSKQIACKRFPHHIKSLD